MIRKDLEEALNEMDPKIIDTIAKMRCEKHLKKKVSMSSKMSFKRKIIIAAIAATLAIAAVMIPLAVMMNKAPDPTTQLPVATNSTESKTEKQTTPTDVQPGTPTNVDPTKPTDDPVTPTNPTIPSDTTNTTDVIPTSVPKDLRVYAAAPGESTREYVDEKKVGSKRTIQFHGCSYEAEYVKSYADDVFSANNADEYAVNSIPGASYQFFLLDADGRIKETNVTLPKDTVVFSDKSSAEEVIEAVKKAFTDTFDFSYYEYAICRLYYSEYLADGSFMDGYVVTFYNSYSGYTIDDTLTFKIGHDRSVQFITNKRDPLLENVSTYFPIIRNDDMTAAVEAKMKELYEGYDFEIVSVTVTNYDQNEPCLCVRVNVDKDQEKQQSVFLYITTERTEQLRRLREEGREAGGSYLYREQVLLGRIKDGEKRISDNFEDLKRIVSEYTDFASAMAALEERQPYPDYVGGSGVSLIEYWTDRNNKDGEKLVIIYEQGQIFAESTNPDGKKTSEQLL